MPPTSPPPGEGGQFPKNLNWCHKEMPRGELIGKAIIRYLYLYKMLNKAKPQESEECYWFFNKCRKQHQSGYQINRDKVNHACIHNKHVWFFSLFSLEELSGCLASGKSWLPTEGNLGFSIAVLAHWKKTSLQTNKQTEYTARKSDTSFLILQRYFAILLWMLPSNSIYNFNFRSWMMSGGPTRKNFKKKLKNGRMPSCQKNRVSGNKNRVIRPTT